MGFGFDCDVVFGFGCGGRVGCFFLGWGLFWVWVECFALGILLVAWGFVVFGLSGLVVGLGICCMVVLWCGGWFWVVGLCLWLLIGGVFYWLDLVFEVGLGVSVKVCKVVWFVDLLLWCWVFLGVLGVLFFVFWFWLWVCLGVLGLGVGCLVCLGCVCWWLFSVICLVLFLLQLLCLVVWVVCLVVVCLVVCCVKVVFGVLLFGVVSWWVVYVVFCFALLVVVLLGGWGFC